jgi:hypothetical protein
MEPVTVADQPAVLEPADADELIGTLLHAATVIGALAGEPGAAGALDACPCPAEHDVTVLWWDLQLAADDLSQATSAAGPAHDAENPPGGNAANARNSATRRNKNRKR